MVLNVLSYNANVMNFNISIGDVASRAKPNLVSSIPFYGVEFMTRDSHSHSTLFTCIRRSITAQCSHNGP